MPWTRRSVLRALGTSAMAPLLAPMIQACGGDGSRRGALTTPDVRPMAQVRQQLAEIVADLSQKFSRASAFAALTRTGVALADASESTARRDLDTGVVLTVASGDLIFEQVTRDVSPDGITAAAEALRKLPAAQYKTGKTAVPIPAPEQFMSSWTESPWQASAGDWQARVEALHAAASRVGGSRIVYRSGYVIVDDRQTLFIGQGRNVSQRIVRTRAGVIFVAQSTANSRAGIGATPVVEVAERSGAMGLEATRLDPAALDAAADRVLSIVSPTAPAAGELELILEPSVSALIARRCIAPALRADLWRSGQSRAAGLAGQPIAPDSVTVIDDPTITGAYGSYFFDDEGSAASRSALIERGALRRPLTSMTGYQPREDAPVDTTSNGRREELLTGVSPQPSNLIWQPGSAELDGLIGEVKRGMLVESGLDAVADVATWRFGARAARAREIVDGKTTGVLHGAVHIHGDVPTLLGSVRGLSASTQRFSSRGPLAVSSSGPYVLTRAQLSPA